MPYLVDGHNLIPKLGLRLDSADDEMQLITLVQEFARLSRHDVEVYFDGAPAGQARTKRLGKVTAHFVRASSSADAAIKAHVARMGGVAKNWTVVTSDRAVQTAARAVHAQVMSSEDFAANMRRLQRTSDRPAGETRMSPEELSEWLKLFGGKK